jgi:hypothetical protein
MELTAKGSMAMTMTPTAINTTAVNATRMEAPTRREAASLQSCRCVSAHCQPLAISHSPLLPATRNTYSSRIAHNLFKTNDDAASYPQLKEGLCRDSFSHEFQSQEREYSIESPQFFLAARGQW